MITSLQNPRLKQVRALLERKRERYRQQAFVIEGARLLEEALAARWPLRYILYSADCTPRARQAVDAAAQQGVEIVQVGPRLLHAVSDVQTSQGVLAVASLQPLEIPAQLDFVLILDGLRDPGNLGTLLRTALAAGVQAVFLPPGNADPFAPKVLRAGMGAQFGLPVVMLDWEALAQRLRRENLKVLLADAAGAHIYTEEDMTVPLALIIGGEADGAGARARTLAQRTIRIPMPGSTESLNAAVAASILLFEVVRQRTV
ncbi:MAG: RNA methyltransferase [Anaerolineae bacterium]|nr:MAG: RNA methyltransferase [Anaerolineae bacterium]